MKNCRLKLHVEIWILLLLLGSPATILGKRINLEAHQDDRTPLENPDKGWYHHFPDNHIDKYRIARDSDLLEFPGMDHLYIRLAWAYLEPVEGRFNWSVIDEIIDKWTAQGLGIAFRISCRETSTDRVEQQFATPRWVIEAGAAGGFYLGGKEVGSDGPWEPRYDDPVYLEKLEAFLAAFASRYDGRDWLRYIDVGSIGDWGEGHTFFGSRSTYGYEARKIHIDLYRKYFKQTQIVVTDDFVYEISDPAERLRMHEYILESGLSYRDDSILVDGYLEGTSDHFTVRSPEFFADRYLEAPTILELEHYGEVKRKGNWTGTDGSNVAKFGKGKKGPDYFRGALELLHATYIGYHGLADQWLADNPELTGELLNRSGYWYFLNGLILPDVLKPGEDQTVSMFWENRGVAPAYKPYRLILRFEGPVTVDVTVDAGNTRWIPNSEASPYREDYTIRIPQELAPGGYEVKVKMWSEQSSRDVRLALSSELIDAEGFYSVGSISVNRPNMVGAYGFWLADEVLGEGPARLSLRTGKWRDLDEWRRTARSRLMDRLAPVDLGGLPEVKVESRFVYDGLEIELLSWQLPAGPRTEAVFLKPAGAKGPLPAVLALHDHGGNKFLGWRKITRTGPDLWPIQAEHQKEYYADVGWANEVAKRGYAVLVHDTFPFASRRVRVADVSRRVKAGGVDPDPMDLEGIRKYNAFAGAHEDIMEKSLISAGTTWPGVYLVEDQRALDVLAARPEVDPERIGCAGLSGGGMRTVFLAGADDRIKVAVAVGFMTTWRDFVLDKNFTHTWMTYVPLLPKDLDFPEILGLRAPAPTMVLNCIEDPLYTVQEMRRADTILKEVFDRAGAPENYRCNFYPGGHKFDLEMQRDAFDWFDRFLK